MLDPQTVNLKNMCQTVFKELKSVDILQIWIEIEAQGKNNVFHIIFLFWSPVWSGVLMPESNHVAQLVHHNAKFVAVLS
jgi:hypothetical protein